MKITLNIAAALVLMMAGFAPAATPAEIVNQKRTVSDIAPGADAINSRLHAEVQKIVDAGRLAPFRTLYGEGGLRYHWREPWQMPFTLALALPYLNSELQGKVKTYLKEEIAARPPWENKLLGLDGTRRQADDLPDGVFNSVSGADEVRTPFMGYALWLYADRTGDVATIKQNWPAIKSNFAKKSANRPNLETLSGLIGMYRLAKVVQDTPAADEYLGQATAAVEAVKDFSSVVSSSNKIYTGQKTWNREAWGVLYAFYNLTPEATRALNSHASIKAEVADYAQSGWKVWPFWWMAQAPVGAAGFYGEGCCSGPEQQGMLMQYEAWIAGTPADKLAYHSDVPDALIGDCTWIRNAVTVIEAFGKEKWE